MMTDLLFLDESNAMRHWLCFRASGNPLLIPPPNLDVWAVAREAQQQAHSKNADRKTELAAEKVRLLRARMSVISTFIDMGQENERRRSVEGDAGAAGMNTAPTPDPAASQGDYGDPVVGATPVRAKPDLRERGDDSDAELSDGEHEIIMLADAIPARQVSSKHRRGFPRSLARARAFA